MDRCEVCSLLVYSGHTNILRQVHASVDTLHAFVGGRLEELTLHISSDDMLLAAMVRCCVRLFKLRCLRLAVAHSRSEPKNVVLDMERTFWEVEDQVDLRCHRVALALSNFPVMTTGNAGRPDLWQWFAAPREVLAWSTSAVRRTSSERRQYRFDHFIMTSRDTVVYDEREGRSFFFPGGALFLDQGIVAEQQLMF